ncbi:MAG: DUF6250 domain-containing protein [Chitinophagaceae bacterium]
MTNLFPPIFLCLSLAACFSPSSAQPFTKGKLLFADDFSSGLDSTNWIAEIDPKPNSSVYVKDGKMVLDTKGGVTVWLNKMLEGNIIIEYKRKVLMQGGANDRLSDLNQFWMATDPAKRNLFTRNGVLEAYDSLSLYYVGMGGNTNKTSRFRKYEGNGERRLIQEYTDSQHLLQPNKEYLVRITVSNGTTTFSIDDETWFVYTDPKPLRVGYFGFRSTKSRQEIDEIKVYEAE